MSFKSIKKMLEIRILRVFMTVLHIFPIKQNRIILNSYTGTQYSCNPKYITEAILKRFPDKYEIIWTFKEPDKFQFLEEKGIKVVKYASIKRFYYEATAKVSINNIGSYSWQPIRKGQQHVNTWHSALDLNNCALMESANDKIMKKTIFMNAKETSLFLSANRFFTEFCIPKEFGYNGKILEYGLPRNDDYINGNAEKIKKEVRKKLNIAEDAVVVMYAPTWRYGKAKDAPKIDLELLNRAMQKRFGQNYLILFRAHHFAGNISVEKLEHVKNMTEYPSIQELIMATNILITDYSSVMWDAALMGEYVLLFAPDLEKYSKERGLYIPINEWCFPVSLNNKDLAAEIEKVELEKGIEISKKHLEKFGNLETGRAAEEFCNWLEAIE